MVLPNQNRLSSFSMSFDRHRSRFRQWAHGVHGVGQLPSPNLASFTQCNHFFKYFYVLLLLLLWEDEDHNSSLGKEAYMGKPTLLTADKINCFMSSFIFHPTHIRVTQCLTTCRYNHVLKKNKETKTRQLEPISIWAVWSKDSSNQIILFLK